MSLSRGIFIVGAKRTAFGAYGGKLKNHTATDLQEIANREVLKAAKVDPNHIDSVIVGNVVQSSTDAAYISRHSALRVGIPVTVPALTINRLCGSGFQSIVNAVQEICCGDSNLVLTGGSESMTQCPYVARNIRFGTKLGSNIELEDVLWTGLTDQHCKTPMGITAENLAEKYSITREECDKFALSSQTRWRIAQESGVFKNEIAEILMKTRKGEIVFDTDEHPRPNVTYEDLKKLPSVFKKKGTVSAGNASGICDGAGAVLVASEEACTKHNMTPLARIVAYQVVGVEPTIMGIGPVNAIKGVLEKANMKKDDIGLFEVNEAFAAQFLAVQKAAELNPEITNVSGGAIALGHPLAASGSRIIAHLVHELRRKNLKYGLGSACIGGGQGIAILLESMH